MQWHAQIDKQVNKILQVDMCRVRLIQGVVGWCGEGGIAVGGVNNSEMSVGCEA